MAPGATSSTGRPRRVATASGDSSIFSAATAACTMLIGLDEPRLLESTSWMPAHSSTARTGPPAITPVPALAGLSSTTPPASSPCTGCGIEAAMRGTLKKCFLASSTPLAMAAGTSLALPYPTPTVPSPSPTTTSAVKLNRRPPLTTLATRLMVTTRSRCGVFSTGALPRPPSRRSRRPPPSELPDPPPLRCCPGMRCVSFLELESGFAGGVREGGDPPGVLAAATVEDDLADAGGLGPLGHERPDLAGQVALGALAAPDGAVHRG